MFYNHMIRNKRYIPNPNKITELEKQFINENSTIKSGIINNHDQYKGRMISMSDSFYNKLNNYLKCNPTEGNRSSFIVRIIAEYIDKRNHPGE